MAGKESMSIRPIVSLVTNAGIIAGTTAYTALGGPGLAAAALMTAAAGYGTAKNLKARQAKRNKIASKTGTAGRSFTKRGGGAGGKGLLGGRSGSSAGRKGGGLASRKGIAGSVARAAKATRTAAAKAARKATFPATRAAMRGSSTPGGAARRAAAASNASRRAAGKSPSRAASKTAGGLAGAAKGLSNGARRVRKAWKASGKELAAKRAAEAKRQAARDKAAAAKVSKTIRRNPDSLKPTEQAERETQTAQTDSPQTQTTPVSIPKEVYAMSLMRQLLDDVEEMNRKVDSWQPGGMREVIAELDLYPQVIEGVTKLARKLHTKSNEDFPLHSIVISLLESVFMNQSSAGNSASEIGPTARSLHRKQLESLEELATMKHHNVGMWDASRNQD